MLETGTVLEERFGNMSTGEAVLLLYIFFIISFIYSPPRPRVLLHFLYSITVQSAAPQTTLWGGPPRPRFEPRTDDLEAGT